MNDAGKTGAAGGKVSRIPELDGLRALMIFIVSWYHIWQQSWLTPRIDTVSLDFLVRSGYVWVDGTVLLSAYLLFMPYARAMRDGTPPPDTRDFYYRRARRILPGYYFILMLVLFAVALPWGLYRGNAPFMVKDIATHLTFVFPFFYDTYHATQLGAACWTLAIEVQAYALFPLVARGVMKKPAVTLGILLALGFGFRAWCLWALEDFSMVVNQLMNFLDVYVIGILLAMAWERSEGTLRAAARDKAWTPRKILTQAGATLVFAGAVWGLTAMLHFQAGSESYPQIQSRQMIYRPVFALCFGAMLFSAPMCVLPLRWLLGNPVMRFLSGISMNYYLIHQTVIVHMKRIGFPPARSEMPNQVREQPWQNQYTFWAFVISFVLAAAITWGIEKPAGRLMDRLRGRKAKG